MGDNANRRTVVIGGGAAGLMAAGRLAERGVNVTLAEKNPMFGKKLRITGKGRCNVTNACDVEEMLENVTTNKSFLYSAFYTFTNDDLIALLKKNGLETKVERGMRVFPVSDNARDVVEALKRYALKSNVRTVKKEVSSLIADGKKVCGVIYKDGTRCMCDSVIVATGGVSYPLTGSTGDGYKFAKEAGHTIVTPKPSLVPVETQERCVRDMMGLALKNVRLSVENSKGRTVCEDFGEMLFTHFGVSGPMVLSASAHMRNIEKEKYILHIDLKPALDEKQLDRRILRDFEQNSNKHIINALDALLPKAVIPEVIRRSGIEMHKAVNAVTKQERMSLVSAVKDFKLTAVRFRPIEEAIVTSGGVDVKQISPSTMESKLLCGLYFAGEVIDVDAYTGGFNLQIAFSTGYLAGDNA